MIRLTVYTIPLGKARARPSRMGNGGIKMYTPKNTVDFENTIALAYQSACRDNMRGRNVPIKLTATFYMPIPKSASKKLKASMAGMWHTKKPDTSNITKSVEDALNRLAYDDDSQIAWLDCKKVYGEPPRLELEFTELTERWNEKHDSGGENA